MKNHPSPALSPPSTFWAGEQLACWPIARRSGCGVCGAVGPFLPLTPCRSSFNPRTLPVQPVSPHCRTVEKLSGGSFTAGMLIGAVCVGVGVGLVAGGHPGPCTLHVCATASSAMAVMLPQLLQEAAAPHPAANALPARPAAVAASCSCARAVARCAPVQWVPAMPCTNLSTAMLLLQAQ